MIKLNAKSANTKLLLSEYLQAWKLSHGTQNRLHISLFGKGITHIDRHDSMPLSISVHFISGIYSLDLSHNAIARLDNIRQFCSLRVLNLAHNHIQDGRQLTKLQKLRSLREVMIKGNAFLKSGEGQLDAHKVLIFVQCDVRILNAQQQQNLHKTLKMYSLMKIKQQHLKHLDLQLELLVDLSFRSSVTLAIENKAAIIQDTYCEENYNYYRKEMLENVINHRRSQFEAISQIESLAKWVSYEVEQLSVKISSELNEISLSIHQKYELINQAKRPKSPTQNFDQRTYLRRNRAHVHVLKNNSYHTPLYPQPVEPNLIIPDSRHHSLSKQLTQNENEPHKEKQSWNKVPRQRDANMEDKFESIYSALLLKLNPIYHLLFSPVASLKSKQKDLLIEALSANLKGKSFELYKSQRIKDEYVELSEKYRQKQKILRLSQQKFLQYKIAMNERIEVFQQRDQRNSQQIARLSSIIQNLTNEKQFMMSKIQTYQEDLSEKKLALIKHEARIQKNQSEERIAEIIQNKRSQRIKQSYLKLIKIKAANLAKLRSTQTENANKQNFELLFSCFHSFKSEWQNFKKCTIINKTLNLKKILLGIRIFKQNARILALSSKVQKSVRKSAIISALKTINSGYQVRKLMKTRLTTINNLTKIQTKKRHFDEWKRQFNDLREQQNGQKANIFRVYKLQQKMFKSWQVFVRLPIYLQAELSADLALRRMSQFVYLLRNNRLQKQIVEQKFLNLIVFLNKSKRIQNFMKIKHYSIQMAQVRSLKEKRVAILFKRKYFDEFVKVCGFYKFHRGENTRVQQQINCLRKKQIFNKLQSSGFVDQMRRTKLLRIICTYRRKCIGFSLKQSLNEFMIEDKRKKSDIKSFIGLLKFNLNRKLKLGSKELKLSLLLRNKQHWNVREFMSSFMRPVQLKKKAIEFQRVKFEKMKAKHFSQWRVSVLQGQIEYLKERIREFGPQIEEISKRQKNTFEEKMVLMTIIEAKQKAIQGFAKQLEEAEHAIITKQDKYQKLKSFLHEAGNDLTIVDSKIQPVYLLENKPERDFGTFNEKDRSDYLSYFKRF